MEGLEIGWICVAVLLAVLALGVPVAVSLAITGMAGMLLGVGPDFLTGQLASLPYAVSANYAYAVLPLFVLMGVLAERSGMTGDVFAAAELWLRPLRGALYQAVVLGSALFAAVSGSTIVNAVVFTRLAFPRMLQAGYARSLSLGAIAAAGSFAAMIPPSITMVIYAIITEQSVGQLLVAGIVPGLLTAAVYVIGLALLLRWRPSLAPKPMPAAPFHERLQALRWLGPVFALVALVLGGLYLGLFAPSAAGAIGASGVLLIHLLRRWRTAHRELPTALVETATISALVFAILIGGLVFSRMLVVLGVVDALVEGINALALSPTGFLVAISAFYLVLGCFLDTTSMMVVTLPFVYPVTQQLGIDPVWFGIVLVKLVEISVITPPVGMNLFAVMSAVEDPDTRFADVVRGVLPFIVLELSVLAMLVTWPALVTWLPGRMLD